ncbi:amino acid-binding protein [Methanosalsum natronophilum]|uniref:Amino acid-binding protein n=1 Tax=Methanosalsum natronophilum TaxID=768733 RepID=A0A3R8CBG8_9EURY|nr:amino acid-binding protein [Methanosalsum natronophilum]MCS3924708.1 putative regulator of amino acid metabolism with ACT domain [Methanosalsum natronophilum]RQD83842.1 MAG: amino acid-binding protein [Methanosalsum natronophilum]
MLNELFKKFEKHPAQEKVLKLLFNRGFRVSEKGKVTSGNIEIPHTQLAKEAGVDRRVIDATTETILSDKLLKSIFANIQSIAFLRDVAPLMDLGVIVITPNNAYSSGILSDVAGVISTYGISIRQAVSDDPYLTEDPRLTLITDKKIPGEVVDLILELPNVKGISIY